uniref:Uncharacterized protein n=1 Tax=Ditylenchus dipsaci TaxID=166011 RepID=A0A915E8Z4_9BILA
MFSFKVMTATGKPIAGRTRSKRKPEFDLAASTRNGTLTEFPSIEFPGAIRFCWAIGSDLELRGLLGEEWKAYASCSYESVEAGRNVSRCSYKAASEMANISKLRVQNSLKSSSAISVDVP